MGVSEPDRHELYQSLERSIGKKPTETFMTIVAQVPWSEVATKRDLADLRTEMHKALRGQLLAFVAIMSLLNAALIVAFKLL